MLHIGCGRWFLGDPGKEGLWSLKNGYGIAIPRPHEPGSGIGEANEWKITVGIIPGYRHVTSGWLRWMWLIVIELVKKVPIIGDCIEFVQEIILHFLVRHQFNAWRLERANAGKMWVTGMIEYKEVLYTHTEGDRFENAQEPVAVIEGIQSPLLNMDQDAWKDTVLDLATRLGAKMRQTRVYVQIGSEIFVLERIPEARA